MAGHLLGFKFIHPRFHSSIRLANSTRITPTPTPTPSPAPSNPPRIPLWKSHKLRSKDQLPQSIWRIKFPQINNRHHRRRRRRRRGDTISRNSTFPDHRFQFVSNIFKGLRLWRGLDFFISLPFIFSLCLDLLYLHSPSNGGEENKGLGTLWGTHIFIWWLPSHIPIFFIFLFFAVSFIYLFIFVALPFGEICEAR